MLPDKKMQIKSIVGMLLLMLVLVLANIGQGTWSWQRITLFSIATVIFIGIIANKIWHILKE